MNNGELSRWLNARNIRLDASEAKCAVSSVATIDDPDTDKALLKAHLSGFESIPADGGGVLVCTLGECGVYLSILDGSWQSINCPKVS